MKKFWQKLKFSMLLQPCNLQLLRYRKSQLQQLYSLPTLRAYCLRPRAHVRSCTRAFQRACAALRYCALVCPFKSFKPDSAMAFLLSACGFIAVEQV